MSEKRKKGKTIDKPCIEEVLSACEQLLKTHQEEKILEILRPFVEEKNFDKDETQSRFSRLLAFGYAHNNKLMEAEEVCQNALSAGDNSPDYHFILTYIHLSLREYDRAIKSAADYFSSVELETQSPHYSVSVNHKSQVYNFLGSAYLETKDLERALDNFKASIENDAGNHLPYINLVNIYNNRGETEQAQNILEDGLKNSRQVQELRLLKENMKNQQTISACLIVKDEEELLPGCLESIRDWVDEIIVVDTGSSDRTVEIAESFKAKIYHQAWEGDFSKHRNYSLEQANCDWVFIIDADERIVEEDVPLIRQYIQNRENIILSINVYNIYGVNKDVKTFLPSVRFWRREMDIRYEGIVHNLLKLGPEHPVTRTPIRLQHLGYDLPKEKMIQKFNRSKELLEKQLDENPDNFFALFNYAQLLKSEGDNYPVKNIPRIIETASRAVELTSPDKKDERHIHLMCLDQIAWAHFYNREYDKSMAIAEKALYIKENYLDPLILVGHIHAHRKEWEAAKIAYNRYLDAVAAYDPTIETDPMIITNIDNRAGAYYSLALIAETFDEIDKAKSYYHRIIENQKGYLESNARLAKIYLGEKNLDEAKKYFNRQHEFSYKTTDSLTGLAQTYNKLNNVQEADELYRAACDLEQFSPVVKIEYCNFLIEHHRDEEAIEQLNRAVELQPDSPEVNRHAGDIYFRLNEFEKAAELYKKILEDNPDTPAILNNLANCYFKLNQLDRAEEYYLRGLNCDEVNNLTYRNLGLTQAGLGKYQEAVNSLEKYNKQESDLPIFSILGDILSGLGDYEKALSNYEKYLSKYPHDHKILFSLSECYLHMGHRDSAAIGYRRVIEIEPDFKPAINRLNEISELTAQ